MPRPIHLVNHHNEVKSRTDYLVRCATRLLKERGGKVTIAAISSATREFSDNNRIVGQTTITSTPRLRRIIEEELGYPIGRRACPDGYRRPTVAKDGWSVLCNQENLEHCRNIVWRIIEGIVIQQGRMPPPEEICGRMRFVADPKVLSRYRGIWIEYICSELPKLSLNGSVSPERILSIMQDTPYYIPGSKTANSVDLLTKKLEWVCSYIIYNTDLPLTNSVINSLVH